MRVVLDAECVRHRQQERIGFGDGFIATVSVTVASFLAVFEFGNE